MNGKVVKQWDGFNTSAGGPARILPGGEVIAPTGARPRFQESLALEQRDFDGRGLWRLARNEEIPLGEQQMDSLRQHHDWQRADFPAGYYSPEFRPASRGSRTLVLTHTTRNLPGISPRPLQDDRLIELDADGHLVWEWTAGDHVEEFGFDAAAREAIRRPASASTRPGTAEPLPFDWLHVNSATYLGPNRWFDAGDERFAPDNVMISSRSASFIAIVSRAGKVVWRMGPDFRESQALRAIGQFVGQHHAHLIPKGLPGAGNLLVFDNGGSSGYGFASPIAPDGIGALARATSRVLEIDPVTLERRWSYAPADGFFSTNISGAQRLANGNTLITEGAGGRVFEVNAAGRIVWEFMNPMFEGGRNAVYRAYRLPYEWIPQLTPAAPIAMQTSATGSRPAAAPPPASRTP